MLTNKDDFSHREDLNCRETSSSETATGDSSELCMDVICINRYMCPGFYRCRSSPVCVHLSDVCDGFSHCPQRDDEWLCDSTCPRDHCRCQGEAFVCRTSFPAHQYSQLRYLDASWSGMSLHNLSNNVYLIRLHLRWCSLTHLEVTEFPNMQTLDLSYNQLTVVNMDHFLPLTRLRSVRLASNPLLNMTAGTYDHKHSLVSDLDISNTTLVTLNGATLFKFTRLKVRVS